MVLYDFLYIDKNKIDSFYAQIFEGLLKQVEQNTSLSKNETEKMEGGIKPFINGEISGFKTIKESQNKTIDPAQIVILDTLSTLSKNAIDIHDAKEGDIVITNGNLHIATNNMLKMFVDVGEALTSEQAKTTKEKKEFKQIKQLMKSFLNHVSVEPIMLLKNNNDPIVGSLKKEFLQDDPDTFQLKYGYSGLDDVFMIGFYENKSQSTTTGYQPNSDFINSSRQFAESIKELFFPANSTVVTPIAIYKEVQVSDTVD